MKAQLARLVMATMAICSGWTGLAAVVPERPSVFAANLAAKAPEPTSWTGQSSLPPCPVGWTRASNADVSLCHPGSWSRNPQVPAHHLVLQAPAGPMYVVERRAWNGNAGGDRYYREHTQFIEVFRQMATPELRQLCMDRPMFDPSPSPWPAVHKDAKIIADGGLRMVFVPWGPEMIVFTSCARGYTQASQDFYQAVETLEKTIAFLKPEPSPTVNLNAPPDPRIENRWTSQRSPLEPYMEYEFKGSKYYENKLEMGTYSAAGGELVIRYHGGRTVSCNYSFMFGQLHLRSCKGGDFPNVFEPVRR